MGKKERGHFKGVKLKRWSEKPHELSKEVKKYFDTILG